VLLVEGESDRTAVRQLAVRLDGDLDGVEVVAMGGITNLGHHLGSVGGGGPVAVLHDAGEAPYVDRALARHGGPVARFVCDADLEDELVRALGVPRALDVVALAGDLPRWEILRNQPFHRDRPEEAVLRRFFGTTSGRKDKYASLLVAALDLDRVPAPLLGAIAAVGR
jgi:hypothetical protein